jgi:excinuclease ABC subunit C
VIAARPSHRIASLPGTPGVYRFRDRDGRVLYIGRATDLRHRVASYWSDIADRRHLRRMVPRIDRIEAVACDSAHEAAWLERNLLESRMPRWNRTAGGQEVPVWIRLDRGPATPGLSVIHEHQASEVLGDYGPYLGGVRVRSAVAGLHRVLPVAYTGTRANGADREMGRVRGLATIDRDVLVDRIAAVLSRDPAAIADARGALQGARDRAADALAFELAARIQDELEALDWITSPQRVTASTPDDLEIHGWSDGTLVRFGIRSGRLCEWSQRPATLDEAAPHLAAAPSTWRDFAERNAELAAALARSDAAEPDGRLRRAAPRPSASPRPPRSGASTTRLSPDP